MCSHNTLYRVNDHFSDTSIFRQSYYRVEKCTESRFFTEMIRLFYGTCSQKMKLLRPMTRTCKPKLHNRLKSVIFGEICTYSDTYLLLRRETCRLLMTHPPTATTIAQKNFQRSCRCLAKGEVQTIAPPYIYDRTQSTGNSSSLWGNG